MTRLAQNKKILELLAVKDDAEIIGHIQGTARDSVLYDQITNRLCDRASSFFFFFFTARVSQVEVSISACAGFHNHSNCKIPCFAA